MPKYYKHYKCVYLEAERHATSQQVKYDHDKLIINKFFYLVKECACFNVVNARGQMQKYG